MIDIANDLKEPLDISDDLKRRLSDSAYWYLSAWEFDPEAYVEDTDIVRDEVKEEKDGRMAEIFEKLRDSVGAIPQFIIAKTAELHATVGHERYEQLVGFSVKNVGRTTLPNNATEFVQSLNLLMQYNASETSRFG